MAQPPGTPRTICRKVTEFLAANEQLRAIKSDLRHLLFEDEVPVRSTARRQPSESDDDGGIDGSEASSSGRGSGKVRFDPNHAQLSDSPKPEKGILKNATPELVLHAESTRKEDTNGMNDTTLDVTDTDDSYTETQVQLSEFEQQLRQTLLKGHSRHAHWWQVIQQTHELVIPECQKKVKGKERYIFICPRQECALQSRKWGELFDHYLQAHFDSHEGEDVKPLACPAAKCKMSFSTLMGFFCHIIQNHPGSRTHGVLTTIYQEHDILSAE